ARPRRPSRSRVAFDAFRRKRRAQDTRPDLGESSVTARGSVVAKRREPAVVGGAKVLDRYVVAGFEYPVAHFFRGLDAWVGGSSDSDEHPVIRFSIFADDFQDVAAVPFTRERDVEVPRLQLEQARQQLRVIDVLAVGRIEIVPRAGMDPDAPALFRREPRQREIVQVDEAVEEMPGGIDLDGQPSFGEVHLNLVRSLLQAQPYLRFVL